MVFLLWMLCLIGKVYVPSDSFNSESYCHKEFEIDIMMVLIFCSLGKCSKEYVIKECKTHQRAIRNGFELL